MSDQKLGDGIASAETIIPDATVPAAEYEAGRDYLPPGAKIGRYMLLGELGRGGMGSVYKAYDPELDRPIALKIVRVAHSGTGSTGDGRVRLAREAQAIAKVAHPNVVAVHDVGVAGHNVFTDAEGFLAADLRGYAHRAGDPRAAT